VVTTTAFAALTAQVADTLAFPDARVAVIEHPLGGIDADAVERRADGIVDRLVVLFTC
jgi:hypothetical protein